jgi:site-specific DNA-methyltransferase (adenine-specific)
MINEVIHGDCMELMRGYPDGYFELACVDPPYGIGEHGGNNSKRTGGRARARNYKSFAGGDASIPNAEYFDELFRVSKNQIIWGANYMVEHLPPSMGWIFWDKDTGAQDFSDGEFAFTSFSRAAKMFRYTWCGFRQGPTNQRIEDRIHPTQKPVKLYDWIFANYAKEGDKILDTHVGSGSSRIAAHRAGLDFIGADLDPDYWAAQEKRYKDFTSQLTLF